MERINCSQQIVAHLGGMIRALMRGCPVNWRSHWRGICRAIYLSTGLPRKEAKTEALTRTPRLILPLYVPKPMQTYSKKWL